MQGDFRIGDRTVVPTLNQIVYGGAAVHVEPKAMAVLLRLAARRGEVARREELIQEVWDGTFVTDDVLKRCISELRRAMADGSKEPRVIETIPKVGYRLLVPVEAVEPQTEGPAARGMAGKRGFLAAAAVVLFGAIAGATFWKLATPSANAAPRLLQLSSERMAAFAAFSPDARQFAFASPGEIGDNWDIWLRIVGEPEARRLTTSNSPDLGPSWSPDGKQIAFVRIDAGIGHIYIVSPMAGGERRLLEFPVRRPELSWSPDGRWIAAAQAPPPGLFFGTGIHLVPVAGGESHPVTVPTASNFEMTPAISPDGSTLAYLSCRGASPAFACDVYVVSLDAEGRARDEPRRLTEQGFWGGGGLAWLRDSRSIVYSTMAMRFSRLWRVRADGSAPPERVDFAGLGVVGPSTVPCCDKLAFVRNSEDSDIYRFQPGAGATPLLASSAFDANPQYSPDGRRIAFGSSRADEHDEIWLANADGSNVTRLTRGGSRFRGSPRWSPDGSTIAFDADTNGHWDIWTIGVDGSGLRQITADAADENMPSWSHDGRFVYYGSNRSGRYEVWRIAVADGGEEQMTRAGGFLPFESRDGRTLYYLRERGGALLARPTAGGPERSIVACIADFGYAVGAAGIFHIDCPTAETRRGTSRALRFWDAATGQDREVATIDAGNGLILGMSVSPDGRSLAYSRHLKAFDLMMIENFR